jgi:cytochrome P450
VSNIASNAQSECPYNNEFNPAAPEEIANPFPSWGKFRHETPVFFSPTLDAYVITRYEDLCAVLADEESFSSSEILKRFLPNPPAVAAILATGLEASKIGAMVMLDGPEHSRIRRHTAAAFTARRMRQLEDEIRTAADELIDAMTRDGPPAEFMESFAYPLPLRIILRLLGLPIEDGERLHRWAGQKLALQWADMELEDHLEAARGFVAFQHYVQSVICERRDRPGDDLISALTQLRFDDDEPLEDAVIVGQVMGLVNAGHETVTTALTMSLFHLLDNRAQWDALCADPGLAATAIEEGLRFDGPAKILWRRAVRETEVAGIAIPAGARVAIVLGSGNRDDTVFGHADGFEIRSGAPKQHLAFGRGIHFCVGANLARLQARIAFERLADRLPSLRLAGAHDMAFARNVSIRIPLRLDLEWDA